MNKKLEDYKFITNFDEDEKHIYELVCKNLKVKYLIKNETYTINNIKINGDMALYFDKNENKIDIYEQYKKACCQIYTNITIETEQYLKNNGVNISNWSNETVDKIAGKVATKGNFNCVRYFLEYYKDDKYMLPKIAQRVIFDSAFHSEKFENIIFQETSKYIDSSDMVKKQRCPKCRSTYIYTGYNILYQQCHDCGYMLCDYRG